MFKFHPALAAGVVLFCLFLCGLRHGADATCSTDNVGAPLVKHHQVRTAPTATRIYVKAQRRYYLYRFGASCN